MRFLVDAQLPARLARNLNDYGHDAVHTLELPERNRTADDQITAIADAEDRVVITKDRDFRDSHLLRSSPRRLLIVATGNISNDDLIMLFDRYLGASSPDSKKHGSWNSLPIGSSSTTIVEHARAYQRHANATTSATPDPPIRRVASGSSVLTTDRGRARPRRPRRWSAPWARLTPGSRLPGGRAALPRHRRARCRQ